MRNKNEKLMLTTKVNLEVVEEEAALWAVAVVVEAIKVEAVVVTEILMAAVDVVVVIQLSNTLNLSRMPLTTSATQMEFSD